MKLPLWKKITGFRPQPKAPKPSPFQAHTSRVQQPSVYYSPAALAAGATTAPTHLLYRPCPSTVGGIVGKNIGAPLYDNIRSAVNRLFRWASRAPDSVTASGQQFITPGIARPRITTREALTMAGLGTVMSISCNASGDLSGALTKAIAFNLLGGLGLFLYGMKLMSEGMHAASGSTMKRVISTLTGNRFSALAVGAGTTAVIQSSSVTTVLTLGLVDAGLMNLTQALGIVAGANIGTTMTGWLFALKVSKYGLPILGASAMTHLFSKNERVKDISKGILGLGAVFFALEIMAKGFKDPIIREQLTNFFGTLRDPSVWGIGKCMLAGAGATALIQSSSATLGITIALASTGIIPYEAAVGLVLGSNVGTTITAWLAAMRPGTTTEARRVAIAHSLFNVLGVLAIWPWSPTFAEMSKRMADATGFDSAAMRVAFVHTLFNVGTSLAFIATLNPFERLVRRLAPEREDDAGQGQRRLSEALLKSPEFALPAARSVIDTEMHSRVKTMFELISTTLSTERSNGETRRTMALSEEELDQYQVTLIKYFRRLEQGTLNKSEARTLDALRRITVQLETASDHLLGLFIKVSRDLPPNFPEKDKEELADIHRQVMQHFILISRAVAEDNPDVWTDVKVANGQLKQLVAENEEAGFEGSVESQIFFRDVMSYYRQILSNLKNVADALASRK